MEIDRGPISPEGASINDGIDKALASISYVSVDNVAEVVLKLGRGAFMGKCDVQNAYRNVPIHPRDTSWLGLQWSTWTRHCHLD